MSLKFNFVLIATCAVLQFSLGAIRNDDINSIFQRVSLNDLSVTLPPRSSDEDFSDSISNYGVTEREKLYIFVLDEYYQVTLHILSNGKQMLQDIVDSLEILKAKNKKINAKIEEFSDLIEKVEKIEKQNESLGQHDYKAAFDLFETFSKVLEGCNATAMENPDVEDLLIDISLEKFGMSALDDMYWSDFWYFMHQMLMAAEEYWNTLSTEEQAEDEEFHQWLMEHRANENAEMSNKIQLYRKFFQLYQD